MIKDGSHRCLDILSKASVEISQGEVLQLLTNNYIQTSESKYLEVINAKTAELFAAACRIGAVISENSIEKETSLYEFGKYLGMAFQIVDDALDYFSVNNKLGKNIGDDFKEGKVTLPIILAFQRSNKKEKNFWVKVINNKEQISEDLDFALNLIKKYNIIEDCYKKARYFSTMAIDSLGIFEESFEKRILTKIANFTIERLH